MFLTNGDAHPQDPPMNFWPVNGSLERQVRRGRVREGEKKHPDGGRTESNEYLDSDEKG